MINKDNLSDIFHKREAFMKKLNKNFKDGYPEWPVDLSTKESQNVVRETALKGVEEMFEALGHLKNWKPHRRLDIPDINREDFLEEIVDSFNYFFSLLILVGVNEKEFMEAFNKKDVIIRDRLNKGY